MKFEFRRFFFFFARISFVILYEERPTRLVLGAVVITGPPTNTAGTARGKKMRVDLPSTARLAIFFAAGDVFVASSWADWPVFLFFPLSFSFFHDSTHLNRSKGAPFVAL
jgi:hypothetical protein